MLQKSSQKLCAKAGVQFAPQARYALGRKKVKKTYSGQENQRSTRIFPKSSENNERNSVVISTPSGQTMEVRQIAGLIARRICCWISIGQDVKRGDKFGMIRFGSRIEILVKRDAFDVYLQEGQYVYGGQTIIGKWR